MSSIRLFALLVLVATAPAARADAPKVLRVSAIPDEAPTELTRKFKPLGDYLEKALGIPVKFQPVTDYAATVEGLAGGHLDLVWYGGFTFVQARHRTGNAIPLVQRELVGGPQEHEPRGPVADHPHGLRYHRRLGAGATEPAVDPPVGGDQGARPDLAGRW